MPLIDLAGDGFSGRLAAKVCVVGSGPAGAIAACALAARGVDVILLEAGGRDAVPGTGDAVGRVRTDAATDLRFGGATGLGGASTLWAGRAAPMEAIDFAWRDWMGAAWPFGAETLEPFYRRAAALLGLPGHDYFEDRAAGPLVAPGLTQPMFQWSGSPFRADTYVEGHAKRHPNLRVVLNARVARLDEAADGKIARAIVAGPAGEVPVEAEIFVLAAGGLDTPRILLNSRDRQPQGIGNAHDMVGRYFSTHPKADAAILTLRRAVSTADPLFGDLTLGQGRARRGIGLSADLQALLAIPNHYVQLSPVLEYQANRLFERIKGSAVLTGDLLNRQAVMRNAVTGLGLMAFEAVGRVARLQRRAKVFALRAFLDQYPDPAHRLTLSTERDAQGVPKIDIDWSFTAQDRQSLLAFFGRLDETLRAAGTGSVDYSVLQNAAAWPLIGIHSHFMGTTRMGDDPARSVADADARVHGVPNLYIAGPSLFPTYGYANPVYTIAALSLRLADHLATRLNVVSSETAADSSASRPTLAQRFLVCGSGWRVKRFILPALLLAGADPARITVFSRSFRDFEAWTGRGVACVTALPDADIDIVLNCVAAPALWPLQQTLADRYPQAVQFCDTPIVDRPREARAALKTGANFYSLEDWPLMPNAALMLRRAEGARTAMLTLDSFGFITHYLSLLRRFASGRVTRRGRLFTLAGDRSSSFNAAKNFSKAAMTLQADGETIIDRFATEGGTTGEIHRDIAARDIAYRLNGETFDTESFAAAVDTAFGLICDAKDAHEFDKAVALVRILRRACAGDFAEIYTYRDSARDFMAARRLNTRLGGRLGQRLTALRFSA